MACCESRSKCEDDQGSKNTLSGASRLFAWMGGNSVRIDAAEAANKLKQISPTLLQEGEEVDMAFKCERDHFYFTTYRILLRYKRGLTGARVMYKSVPYASIKAFTVQSAGQYFDADSELSVWASGVGHIKLDFVKDMVDPLEVQRYFNCKVLSEGKVDPGHVGVHVGPGAIANPSKPLDASDFWNMLFDDAKQVEAAYMEKMLKRSPSVLEEDEQVQLAFKCGRDFTLFTTKRLLVIDVKGISGKKVAYRTVLWKTFRAFAVETAGGFLDRDAELRLWTSISEMRLIRQDLRKGKADVFAIQKFLSNMLLGLDTKETSQGAASVSAAGRHDQGTSSLFEWIGDDMRQVDEKQVDTQLHSDPPILQGCESVEMAFKGRRDMVLFTTKRLLIVDFTNIMMVKKVSYVTVPWTTVKAFAVRTAGSFMDKDCEMMIWTDIMHEPGVGDDPPQPGMAMLVQDFSKDKVDLMAIHRYLSERCLQVGRDSSLDAAKAAPLPVKPEILAKGPPEGAEKLLNWLGQDARQIDPKALDEQMHSVNPMLQSDEHVVMAFKVGRDTALITGKRWITIDVQGFSGAKVMYKSVPLTSVRAFSVESAGSWDRDAEVKLYIRTHWDGIVSQDLRKGFADIDALQSLLSNLLFGNFTGVLVPSTSPVAAAGSDDKAFGVKDMLAFLGQDFAHVDAAAIDKRFHTSPAILLDGETVDAAFKVGRDLFLLTDRRLLDVDVQGFSGQKVEYKSVPLRFCTGCLVQSAGMLDFDAESVFYTDVPSLSKIGKDLRQGEVDIFGFEKAAVAKVLKNASFKNK